MKLLEANDLTEYEWKENLKKYFKSSEISDSHY